MSGIKSVILKIFNIENKETTRFTVPPYAIKKGIDYRWIKWKFFSRHNRDHIDNACWDTETRIDGKRVDMAKDDKPGNTTN